MKKEQSRTKTSRRRFRAMFAVAALLWICGCGIPAAPIDLIKPPQLAAGSFGADNPGDLRAMLPAGAKIAVAGIGAGGDAISYGDVDGDGFDEAIVVYEEGGRTEKAIKAALFKRQQERWHVVWDTKGYGRGLDYAGVADLNRDGSGEILLGWTMGAGENGLDIYEWKNNSVSLRSQESYQGRFVLSSLYESTGE